VAWLSACLKAFKSLKDYLKAQKTKKPYLKLPYVFAFAQTLLNLAALDSWGQF